MSLVSRPPVVAILGHVDHGKTSLLDYIRKAKVAAGEAGGITQHIGAYQAEHNGQKITFIDTPGHAAFSKMRSRGAQVTDFVILVVAANDGVKPQTIESIEHIKKSGVPFIVAINKIDLPDVYPDVTKGQLAEHGVLVTGFGGDTEVVEVSAKTGKGIDNLLETILLMAEVENIQADPNLPMSAVVIEAVRDPKIGPVVTMLVREGTLRERDEVYSSTSSGKVKRMTDAAGQTLKEVSPGMPAEILGFTSVPMVGETVGTTPIEISATIDQEPTLELPPVDMATLLGEGSPKLNIILKSDTVGTLQAIEQSFSEEINLIFKGVGAITENDVLLAETSGAQLIGFAVQIPKSVQKLADEHGVRVRVYKIIYELLENLQKQVLKLIEPTIDEEVTGEAVIKQIFEMKGEKIAGCKVKKGEIKKTDLIHIKRDDQIIGDPKIKSIKTGKEEVEIRKTGDEGGIVFTRYSNFQVGDSIVAYQKLDD